jgi:hypothetical protein
VRRFALGGFTGIIPQPTMGFNPAITSDILKAWNPNPGGRGGTGASQEFASVIAAAASGQNLGALYGSNVGLTSLGTPWFANGSISGGASVPSLPSGSSSSAVAQHVLDLVTSGGVFQVSAHEDTIEAMRSSAIGDQLTSTGQKPSWY